MIDSLIEKCTVYVLNIMTTKRSVEMTPETVENGFENKKGNAILEKTYRQPAPKGFLADLVCLLYLLVNPSYAHRIDI